MSSFFKKLKFLFSSNFEIPTEPTTSSQPLVPLAPAPIPDPVSTSPLASVSDPVPASPSTPVPNPVPTLSPTPILDPIPTQTPTPEPPLLPPQELLSLLEEFKQIPALTQLGAAFESLLQHTPLNTAQVTSFLQTLETFIQNVSSQITQLKASTAASSTSPLDNLLVLSKKVSQETISTDAITHDNFLSHPQFVLLQTHLKFCQELNAHATTLNFAPENLTQIEELVKVGVAILEKINALTPTITSFKGTEQSLREEIVSFSNVISKLQSQPGLTPDWNGNKEALTQKREELSKRKAAYEEDENKINQAITVVTQNIPTILQKLQPLATNLLPLIESTHAQSIPASAPTASSPQLAAYEHILDLLTRCKHSLTS